MAVLNTYLVGVIAILISVNAVEEYKLELVQVIFRHGARYPDLKEVAVAGNDEYYALFNNTDTLRQLLKIGKIQEYEFGQKLRDWYDQFLGEFKYEEVYARSTNYDRTKMSLQLVLAGLYPPTKNTSWSNKIFWSPIPTYYEPINQIDFLDITYDSVCMKNGELVDQAMNSPDILNQMERYEELGKKIKRITGVKEWNPISGYQLYAYLTSISNLDLPLPGWCTPKDLIKLRKIAAISMDTLVYTPQMKRISVGLTIEEILKNIDNKENNKRKIYLYSAHDTNIGPFVRVHNFTDIPIFPDFGSAVLIEKLRSRDGQLYIRMFYWTGTTGQLIPVKLRDGDNIYLLSKYRSDVAPLLPTANEAACFSPESLCKKVLHDS